jgi:ribonuclease T2
LILKVIAAALIAAASCVAGSASAREPRPGDFDFYVLSLSWSPTYCLDARPGAGKNAQCAGERPFAFVVHGLWPQYERGFPEYCSRPAARIPEAEITSMLDLMPSKPLIIHQWRKHGSCSGLNTGSYFEAVRRARARVVTPPAYAEAAEWRNASPDDIEKAFLAANPGLRNDMIAVQCKAQKLQEVRICMTRDLAFRACPEVDRRACRADRVALPPSRP